jgi:hypothetical protein
MEECSPMYGILSQGISESTGGAGYSIPQKRV